jgi:hypothetical protein
MRKTTTYFLAAYVLVAVLGFCAKYKARAEISSSGGHKQQTFSWLWIHFSQRGRQQKTLSVVASFSSVCLKFLSAKYKW